MYSSVCPKCGEKSDKDIQHCPVCGSEKSEQITRGTIFKDLNDVLVEKLSFLDYPQLYVTVITRLVIMLFIIFIIPDFISNSEFFWMLIGIFSVYGLIKEIAKRYRYFIPFYKISKILLFAYFGAGVGNVIAHTGRGLHYRFSYYFNIEFILSQISLRNGLIFVGAIFGIIAMIILNQFKNDLGPEDQSE